LNQENTALFEQENKKEEDASFEALEEDTERRKEHFQTGWFMALSERP